MECLKVFLRLLLKHETYSSIDMFLTAFWGVWILLWHQWNLAYSPLYGNLPSFRADGRTIRPAEEADAAVPIPVEPVAAAEEKN